MRPFLASLLCSFSLSACVQMDTGADGSGSGTSGGTSGSSESGLVALNVATFCDRTLTCSGGGSAESCRASFAGTRVTKACGDALTTATCAQLSDTNGVVKACFPACNAPGASQCTTGGQIATCSFSDLFGNITFVTDCAQACLAAGQAYTGTCGRTANGQVSEKDKCWCQ